MNYIITSSNKIFLSFLYDFVISLMELGQFKGKLIILYYKEFSEEEKDLKKLFDYKNIEWVFFEKEMFITNSLFIDSIDVIKNMGDDDKIALYDADIWFCGNINELFNNTGEKVIVEPETIDRKYLRSFNYYTFLSRESILNSLLSKPKGFYETTVLDKEKSFKKILKIMYKTGDFINSGFIFAKRDLLLKILSNMKEIFYMEGHEEFRKFFGLDQWVLNLLIDLDECDVNRNYIYNFCSTPQNLEDLYYNNGYYFKEKNIIAFHLIWETKLKKGNLFKNVYKDIFMKKYNKLNFKQKKLIDNKYTLKNWGSK